MPPHCKARPSTLQTRSATSATRNGAAVTRAHRVDQTRRPSGTSRKNTVDPRNRTSSVTPRIQPDDEARDQHDERGEAEMRPRDAASQAHGEGRPQDRHKRIPEGQCPVVLRVDENDFVFRLKRSLRRTPRVQNDEVGHGSFSALPMTALRKSRSPFSAEPALQELKTPSPSPRSITSTPAPAALCCAGTPDCRACSRSDCRSRRGS